MDNNDSKLKSQQTGGLKLMTVFIAVLALHVVVIGGFTVYHLMSGGSSDTDMTTGDKTHKGLNGTSVADGSTTDSTQGDKSTSPTEVATIPAATATPAPTTPTPDATAATAPATSAPATATTSTPAPTSAPDATTAATTSTASTPAPSSAPAATAVPEPAAVASSTTATSTEAPASAPAPVTEVANPGPQVPSGPIPAGLAPPPDVSGVATPAPALVPVPQSAPAPSLAAGPVHMPPPRLESEAPRTEHEHMKVYTVKITDSYRKIARRYHISVAQLKEANHINNNVLHTGQRLYIPGVKSEVVDKAPSSPLDAAPILSESASPMTTGLTSTSTTIPSTSLHHHIYTVVKGDTLARIAHRYRTTAAALMAENDITDPTKLTIGKKLRIPSAEETRSARNTPPASTQPSQVQAKTSSPTAQLANYGN